MADKYDFSGYATKNDLKCSDGRTIRKDAFKDCDGTVVPLVWQHGHGKPGDVLGHALLENREDGVYTYGSFNETESGKNAKELVRHGDVRALSIYANQLVQKGGDVLHGMIREVSLCLAGANPGAVIEDLSFGHYDDEDSEFEAQIWNGENIELLHADTPKGDEKKEPKEALKEEPKEEKKEEKSVADQDTNNLAHKDDGDETVKDIFESMNEKQKNVVYYLIGEAVKKYEGDDAAEEDKEEKDVKHNAFEGTQAQAELMHDAMNSIFKEAKRMGSLRDAYNDYVEHNNDALAHAVDTTGMITPEMTNPEFANAVGYGVNDLGMLFPDAKSMTNEPQFIKRDTSWAQVVWNGVHRTPWSRTKSLIANITEDEARAKGYIKGNMKKEEFFSVMKRITVPQTIYKKQKLDRDDIIDITDFDVVRWIRAEMRTMWDEETARAILIGDGRVSGDDDKISEECIRPIADDVAIYSIQATVTRGADEYATAKNFMRTAVRSRKDYKGAGNPILFTTEDMLTSMLLIEDGIGHNIYKSEAELATALRVRNIVTVPVMEGHKLKNGNELLGIIVNLTDYNVGTDKGGEVTMFDDFDIDYNQYKYLIESRCSGALVTPYSAIVLSVASA